MAWFLSVIVAAGSLWFAEMGQASEQVSAERVFQTRCATCHSLSRALRPLRGIGERERRKHLEGFLIRHYAPEARERALLVEYLLSASR